jgi:hypothetical protein
MFASAFLGFRSVVEDVGLQLQGVQQACIAGVCAVMNWQFRCPGRNVL